MPSAHKRPSVLRHSWRPSTTPWKLGRQIRRVSVAALAIVLVLALFYLLFAPFRHPNSHLLLVAAKNYQSSEGSAIKHASAEFTEFGAISMALHGSSQEIGTTVHALESPAAMDQLIASLDSRTIHSGDVVIIHIRAHGVTLEGEPYLLCENFDAAVSQGGRYSISRLFAKLRQVPATYKLLILDTGYLNYDRRLGLIVNQFPEQLQLEVARSGDPGLWVLHSHAAMEQSYTSRELGQSVFGHFVVQGLQGEADINENRFVELGELYRYVRGNVSAWVENRVGGTAAQTPLLLGTRGNTSHGENLQLLPVAPAGLPITSLAEAKALASPSAKKGPTQAKAAPQPGRDDSTNGSAKEASTDGSSVPDNGATAATEPTSADPHADNSATATATSGEGSSGATDTVGESTGVNGPSPPLDFASEEEAMQYDAWRLIDDVANRQTSTPNPIDFAPQHWRVLSSQILATSSDVVARLPDRDPQQLKTLEQLLDGLRTIVSGDPIRPTTIEIVQQMDAIRPRLNVSLDEVRTLGLLKHAAKIDSLKIPPQLRKDLASFDAALAADDRKAFDKWMEDSWRADYERYDELQLARRLFARQETSWELIQVALSTWMLGEQVAADDTCLTPWIQQSVEQADRHRTAGLRTLFDAIGANSDRRALRLFGTARMQYQRAADQAVRVRAHVALRNDLLMLAPDYVRLAYLGARTTQAGDERQLIRMIDSLADFTVALEQFEETTPDELERLAERLTQQRAAIEDTLRIAATNALASSDDPAWVIAYLDTQIPSAATRRTLSIAASSGPVDANPISAAVPVTAPLPPSLSSQDWLRPAQQADLELRIARLATLSGLEATPTGNRLHAAFIDSFAAALASTDPPARLPSWEQHRTFGSTLQQLYADLPRTVTDVMQNNDDLSDPAQRSTQLANLRAAERGVRVMDTRDLQQVDFAMLNQSLQNAKSFDLLGWHITRWHAARDDAPTEQARRLTEMASRYRLLAMAIPQQPTLPAERVAAVNIDGPTSTSLVTVPQREMVMTVRSRGTANQPAWLIVDYDTTLLHVTVEDLAATYVQSDLAVQLRQLVAQQREAMDVKLGAAPLEQTAALANNLQKDLIAAERAAEYPVRPDRFGLAHTFMLPPGQGRNVKISASALGKSPRSTRLILKVIAADAYVRHAVEIALPNQQTLVLSAAENLETWSTFDGGIELHPLPGHETPYRLQLANRGISNRSVDVQLLALQKEARNAIPEAVFTAQTLERTLEPLQPLTPLAAIENLTLPATGDPVRLRFPPGGAAASAEPVDDASAGETPAPDDPAAVPDEDAQTAPSVRHGLLLVITDRETQESIVRRIDFKPRRPRRYLQAIAAYDLARERLSIRVTPLDRSQVPEKGFQVRCEFANPLPRSVEARLTGVVNAPQFAAILYADIPASASHIVTATVHVDGYPRGFTFHVPCSKTDTSITEVTGTLGVTLVKPNSGQSFAAPIENIPVAIRVDAPVGAFERNGDVVEVGIDADRDREFRDEATLKLYSDRQAEIGLLPMDASGALRFDTQVNDIKINIPANSLQNARVNLLARIQVAGQVRWSDPVEVVLDESGPRIDRVRVFPNSVAILDSEIEVQIWGGDNQLSGIAKVLAGFDTTGSGKFADVAAPVPAEQGEGGVWIAKIPAGGVPAGPITLLIQATDSVDNVGEVAKVKMELITKEESEARMKSAVNKVVGVAVYGGTPVPNTEVSLEGEVKVEPVKTDDQGRFVFSDVTPGVYSLKARGVARNRPRSIELEKVEVKPAPAKATRLQLDLK